MVSWLTHCLVREAVDWSKVKSSKEYAAPAALRAAVSTATTSNRLAEIAKLAPKERKAAMLKLGHELGIGLSIGMSVEGGKDELASGEPVE